METLPTYTSTLKVITFDPHPFLASLCSAHAPFASRANACLFRAGRVVDRILKMIETLFRIPFLVLEVPQLKLKKPGFVKIPSSFVIFCLVLFSYFLVTGGVIYDVIVEPPSIGSQTDDYGHSRPVAFMQYRVNGQYIMEGLTSSFLFHTGIPWFYYT